MQSTTHNEMGSKFNELGRHKLVQHDHEAPLEIESNGKEDALSGKARVSSFAIQLN